MNWFAQLKRETIVERWYFWDSVSLTTRLISFLDKLYSS